MIGGITVKNEYTDFIKQKERLVDKKIITLSHFDRMYDFRFMLHNNKIKNFYKRYSIILEKYNDLTPNYISGEILVTLKNEVIITLGVEKDNKFRPIIITEKHFNKLKDDEILQDHYAFMLKNISFKSKCSYFIDHRYITFLSIIVSYPYIFRNDEKKGDDKKIKDLNLTIWGDKNDNRLFYNEHSKKIVFRLFKETDIKQLRDMRKISIKWVDKFDKKFIGVISQNEVWQEIYILKILRLLTINGASSGFQLFHNWTVCKENKLQIGLVSSHEGSSLEDVITEFNVLLLRNEMGFIKYVLFLLYNLTKKGIIHGDLHLGNATIKVDRLEIDNIFVIRNGDAVKEVKDVYGNRVSIPKYNKYYHYVSNMDIKLIDFGASIMHKELIDLYSDNELENYQVLELQKRRIVIIYEYMFPEFWKKNKKRIIEEIEDYDKMFCRMKAIDIYKLFTNIRKSLNAKARFSKEFLDKLDYLISKAHDQLTDFDSDFFEDINYSLLIEFPEDDCRIRDRLSYAEAPLTYSFSEDLETFPPHMRTFGKDNVGKGYYENVFLKKEAAVQEGKKIEFTEEFTEEEFKNL